MKNLDWYHNLNLPRLSPPDGLFAPVWTILYLMIFISLWLVFKTKSPYTKKYAYTFFAIQMILNFLWSGMFFGFKDVQGALIVVFFMLIFIILNIIEFFKINRIAAYLLIPYLLWVSFATYLNCKIYLMNF